MKGGGRMMVISCTLQRKDFRPCRGVVFSFSVGCMQEASQGGK